MAIVGAEDARHPRLSSFLRVRNNEISGKTQHELLIERSAALENAQLVDTSSRRLNWSSFVGKNGNPSPGLRQKFSSFMELCSLLAEDGEQLIGERLEELAASLFDGFISEEGLKRQQVESMLGSRVKQSSIKSARELAQELNEWRSKQQREPTVALRDKPFLVAWDLDPNQEDESGASAASADAFHDGFQENSIDNISSSGTWPWLLEYCTLHVMQMEQSVMTPNDLAKSIISMLAGPSSDDEVQGQLLDLLGLSEGTFEFMMELISKRQELSHCSENDPVARPPPPPTSNTSQQYPIFAPRSRQSANPDNQVATARIDSKSPLERGAPTVALPNMKPGSRPAGLKEEQITFKRITGPGSDSDGDDAKGRYIQVVVPPAKRSKSDGEYRVPISLFGSLAQVAFKGIESLNRLQSAVFDAAYHSNTNLLICAPTGAGKTNVAMTAVVREIERNSDDIHKVKIIYVAPLKALAQEVVEKFGERLKPLGIKVRELTGDMQLTRHQIDQTQLIVTTPEKWDVITRKSGDGTLVEAVGLLIIDEVHLIGEDRGPVIESLVARTLRLVEQKQKMVRIVGLSATLPNYRDVARFLRVDMHNGLFFFDNSFRPVPLHQTFLGVIEKNIQKKLSMLNDIAYERAADSVQRGHQAMIFVHSRKDTSKTARAILEAARKLGDANLFLNDKAISSKARNLFQKDVAKSKNSDLREFFESGIGIHHAGMLRADRSLTEKMFEKGAISVLCCTATLAWGVNLPVHTVIVKGTQIYVAEKGGLVELNASDVFQAFGRAGRPQYDTSGEAVLITDHDQLNRYLSMLNNAQPLESSLDKHLPDALNAEIVSGTVTNLEEAVEWLSYTFLHIRMIMNPLRYGISHKEKEEDPSLLKRRAQLIVSASRNLDSAKMARFALANRRQNTLMSNNLPDMQSPFGVTDLGRVASHYYIGHSTIETFNSKMKPEMNDSQIIDLLCHASEFDQIKVREEEMVELGKLRRTGCAIEILSPMDSPRGKAAILFQCYITKVYIATFTLSSDTNYIAQNMSRVARAVFEISLKKRWSNLAEKMLLICTALERRCWWPPYAHPLRQFSPIILQPDIVQRLEEKGELCHLENLVEMEENEIGHLIRHTKMGSKILRTAKKIPYLNIQAHLQPLTRSILRVTIDIHPEFEWTDRLHGSVQNFWLWVDDQNSEWIYHSERFTLRKDDWKSAQRSSGSGYNENDYEDGEEEEDEDTLFVPKHVHPALVSASLEATNATRREFTIPIFEPLPPQYYLRVYSDNWFGSEAVIPLTLDKLVLPPKVKQHTDLLPLMPLPRSALRYPAFESLYERKFTHFNPIQTQAFHVLYHTDHNVLLGAPTGSGKTISAELALLRVFREYPGAKTVYIAPLKALVSERVKEWRRTIEGELGKRVVEFTGDVTPNTSILNRADVLITTPEKWDGATRMWQQRDYIQKVKLVIIDEIHLLGEERGAVLEVLVTRMRYIAETSNNPVRIVGLSTALANAHDLANWLGIKNDVGLYNFRPAVRPVPMEAHIHGFPGKHYCPRMATMNKPTYQAILSHSPNKPVLVFVASRRQTRLTALDLISLCAASENPRRFLKMSFDELEPILLTSVTDDTLKHTLAFGIGIHHAGLDTRDRDLVEDLYLTGKIQILVCTSTLAWGVNFPAHLVVIKGTEYYDAKSKRYQPFPVTDVLQMMGRAGRPQFDDSGVAMIFVEESLKDFYKKFLYEPFPVESHLAEFLHNHLNAEIASGSISSEKDALDYLSWTYFFRRLPMNPSYYGLESGQTDAVAVFLIRLIRQIFNDLESAGCVSLQKTAVVGALSSAVAKSKEGTSSEKKGTWKSQDSVTEKADKELLDKKLNNFKVEPTKVGKIASFYYLDYRSMRTFAAYFEARNSSSSVERKFRDAFEVISDAYEYSQVPVRHNEDELNVELSTVVPWSPFLEPTWMQDSPHAKTFLLLQSHCRRIPAPIKDYINDTKSVLDQCMRILNALVELCAVYGEAKNLDFAITLVRVSQCLVQGRFWDDSALSQFSSTKTKRKQTAGKVEDSSVLDNSLVELVSKQERMNMEGGDIVKKLPEIRVSSMTEGMQLTVKLNVVSKYHSKVIPFGRLLKSRDYSWWILVASGNEILHMKHFMGLPQSNESSFSFNCSNLPSPTHIYFMSGSIIGLDQVISLS